MSHREDAAVQRRALARDAAVSRLRRFTAASVAGAVALGGIFAALAAAGSPGKKTVAPVLVRRHPARAKALRAAPAAPLVPVASGESPSSPAAPSSPPSSSYEPPVVSSGGS